ncbi:sigma factor G inhibitor Gin [Niallia taxi]|uniref:sigma factor G inhibitor Gin n=2 Tax=Niallia taxi TaxID=2499688 RepID=UPI003AB3F0C9
MFKLLATMILGRWNSLSIESQKLVQPYVEECLFCGQKKMTGIHLYQSLICTDCEHEMLNTKTNDIKYKFYVQKLKNAHYALQRRQA